MPVTPIEQRIFDEFENIRASNHIQLRFLEEGEDILDADEELEEETRQKNIADRAQALTFWQRIALQNATEKALRSSYERVERLRKAKPSKQEIEIYLDVISITKKAFMALSSQGVLPSYEDAKKFFVNAIKKHFIAVTEQSLQELVDSLKFSEWLKQSTTLSAEKFIKDNRERAETFLNDVRFYSPEHFTIIDAVQAYLRDVEEIEGNSETPVNKRTAIVNRLIELQTTITNIQTNASFEAYADQTYGEQYNQQLDRSFKQLYDHATGTKKITSKEELNKLLDTTIPKITNESFVEEIQKQNKALVRQSESEINEARRFSQRLDSQYQSVSKIQYQAAETSDPNNPLTYSVTGEKTSDRTYVERLRNHATNTEILLNYRDGQLTQVIMPPTPSTINWAMQRIGSLFNRPTADDIRKKDLVCLFDYMKVNKLDLGLGNRWCVVERHKQSEPYTRDILEEMVRRDSKDYNVLKKTGLYKDELKKAEQTHEAAQKTAKKDIEKKLQQAEQFEQDTHKPKR